MSRLRESLLSVRDRGEKSLGIFVTSGFPTLAATEPLLAAIDAGGADFIELGMPFSDPLAEGIPIQKSSELALRNGITMAGTFRSVASFRSESDTPIVLMGYLNPVLRYGISNFFVDAHSSGVDAVIFPDLPPEEAGLLSDEAQRNSVDLIFLVAPTTPDDRIRGIDHRSNGFVYAVSVTGLTGSRLDDRDRISDYLSRVQALNLRNPLLVGFGISNHQDFVEYSRFTDGCIVGSALIPLVNQVFADAALSMNDRMERVQSFVSTLKSGNH